MRHVLKRKVEVYVHKKVFCADKSIDVLRGHGDYECTLYGLTDGLIFLFSFLEGFFSSLRAFFLSLSTLG